MSDSVESTLARWRADIDAELTNVAARSGLQPPLRDAVHYSLTGEGKRLRGLLLLGAHQALGGNGKAVALAAAVEIVHAYSLVHDDLPCMDNDNMRRGRPTTHRAFDVATATVAGVTMVPLAVQQTMRAAECLGLDDATTRRLVEVLMDASGASGMVGGQLMDLDGERRSLSLSELESIHRAKTGSLIACCFTMGALAARADEKTVRALTAAGAALGLAFQIADDVLDATASSETLGKTAGSDAAMSKSTYVALLGVEAARRKADDLTAEAMRHFAAAKVSSPILARLAHFVSARQS